MNPGTIQRSLNSVRIASTSSLLISLFLAVSMFAAAMPYDVIGIVAAYFAGLIVVPIIASPIEWLVHRYIYHRSLGLLRRIYAIHLAHHHLYFPTWRYVTGGSARRIPILRKGVSVPQISKLNNALTHLAHFVFYTVIGAVLIWIPAWLVSQNKPFLLGTISGTLVISHLFITVHDAIHRPGSHRVLENRGWFRFLDDHHYIHHVDTESNVNFLLPLADWLFGTFRRRLTEEEVALHGTKENAKSRIVGSGEPVKQASVDKKPAISFVVETT